MLASMTTAPQTPEPDDKDWTWVTARACPECGYDPNAVTDGDIADALRATAAAWQTVLARPELRERPAPTVWSPLEYACHVRDVHRVFAGRVALMLDEDTPSFANWDQDVAAVEGRYWEADPADVAAEITAGAEASAALFDGVTGEQWDRSGLRSNGASFTVSSIGRYYLHDVTHHLTDVGA